MTIYNAISSNKLKTWIIFIVFFVITLTASYILAESLGYGLSFVGIFLVISGVMSFISYYQSDKIVLKMYGAKPVSKKTNPELFNVVENLTIASGMPMPKVYEIKDSALNAFATGRDPKHAAVAVTTGLLASLKRSELEGVIAHELSHIKNYDTRLMSVVAIIVGSLAIISDFFMRSLIFGGGDDRRNGNALFLALAILAAILAPIAATLMQLAISRKREYLADASGVLLTRYPEGLASALEKISHHPNVKNANHATAHLFIGNPFRAGKGISWINNLFSTHPPAQERIKILRAM